MTINLSAAELTHVVTAVPGVRGIEPGIGSTLKAIGSRMSGDPWDHHRVGRAGGHYRDWNRRLSYGQRNCARCSRGGSALTVASKSRGRRFGVRLQAPASGEGASTVPSLNAAYRRAVSVSGSTHTTKGIVRSHIDAVGGHQSMPQRDA